MWPCHAANKSLSGKDLTSECLEADIQRAAQRHEISSGTSPGDAAMDRTRFTFMAFGAYALLLFAPAYCPAEFVKGRQYDITADRGSVNRTFSRCYGPECRFKLQPAQGLDIQMGETNHGSGMIIWM